ncbi:hypothetical protein [Streptomyces mayonensis]|uniref:hypothetical protein n=1 Tax=Streptomyces mayonensis TaxID=2750816 RepID=UPI001C1DDEF2|nr:hypothetical protein [Streptomyces sp. A108]MBU6536343.1 hypothetical protein [Streptomyces sp. A108]
MSGPHRTAEPTPRADRAPARDGVTDLVRWAAFSCLLVPVALLGYGASFAGTAGAAVGLAAVTAVCRLLLRRSERAAERAAVRPSGDRWAPRSGRRCRPGGTIHRRGRHTGKNTPVD